MSLASNPRIDLDGMLALGFQQQAGYRSFHSEDNYRWEVVRRGRHNHLLSDCEPDSGEFDCGAPFAIVSYGFLIGTPAARRARWWLVNLRFGTCPSERQ